MYNYRNKREGFRYSHIKKTFNEEKKGSAATLCNNNQM